MNNNQPEEGTYLSVSDYLDALHGPDPDPSSVMGRALELTAAAAEITGEYDVRDMTPQQMVEMTRRLHLAGVISLPEYAVLSFQPNLYPQFNYEAATYRLMQRHPQRRRDFIAAWENHLEVIWHHHPDPPSLQLSEQIIELLRSFEPPEDEETLSP
ncbi:MAG TPA: hypothetical protein ENH84_01300 [Phycisphaerae bacterium]|nr:hypothetical protein [Phycisphaerae bacterium]